MSADPALPFIIVASILHPQGRRGEVLCELLTDFPEKFSERKRLFLLPADDAGAAREITLEDFWMPQGRNAGRIVLKFAGCDSIDDAEKLARLAVAIPQEERATLAEDEFFAGDLIGCEIVTKNRFLGRVRDVDTASAGTALLIVENDGGEEILLPLAKAYLLKVDVAAKRIEMNLPEGLVEINRREPKS